MTAKFSLIGIWHNDDTTGVALVCDECGHGGARGWGNEVRYWEDGHVPFAEVEAAVEEHTRSHGWPLCGNCGGDLEVRTLCVECGTRHSNTVDVTAL
jgi:hypothetical protein